MSRDRVINFVAIAVGIFLLMFASFVGGQLLDPVREEIEEGDADISKYGGQEMMDQTFSMVTLWLPLVGGGGLIMLGLWREYRRQRVTAVPRGPPR